MAKQALVGALEEVLGEYVLNIDKENLKIAALRGKIKLENVQLDGDLLGGHILGSMGLSGFGILSCWAKSMKVSIPLKNLEKEPTRIEITGCHLLCLPLLPSTANKLYGSGTLKDPKCTLRTRAKRAKLARFEKNYLSGRIPGEGQTSKRIQRAVRDVERNQKKKLKRKGSQAKSTDEDLDASSSIMSLVTDLGETATEGSTTDGSTSNSEGNPPLHLLTSENGVVSSEDLPELPRDWKVKLRQKVMRNLHASMNDIHVRCEVSEGGLDFCHPDHMKRKREKQQQQQRISKNEGESASEPPRPYDQRSFSFGATLDKFIVRTANEKWEEGSHETKPDTTETDHLGPNPYDARNNKIFTFENFSMYWDDEPAFLISESDLICSRDHKVSPDKFHTKIAAAMAAVYEQQEPGPKIRESLQMSGKRRSEKNSYYPEKPHQYCWKGFEYKVRQKLSNRTEPGPLSCQAEFLPFNWNMRFRPHQFVQYQKLKSAMLSQQRFDTMMRQRPSKSPLNIPREWWKYAFGCVTSRPNVRPWNDVMRIGKKRDRYIELVVKKLSQAHESSGYHGGLSELESAELVSMEDLLPLEALHAFHLVALRIHTGSPLAGQWKPRTSKGSESPGRARSLTGSISRIFSRSRSSKEDDNGNSKEKMATPSVKKPLLPPIQPKQQVQGQANGSESISLLEAMTLRLGKKMWKTNLKLFLGGITITLVSAKEKDIARLVCEAGGSMRVLGQGNLDYFFDVTKFEMEDCRSKSNEVSKILVVHPTGDIEPDSPDDLSNDLSWNAVLPTAESDVASTFMDLPPFGVLCRVAASREKGGSKKLSISAHPATLMWTRPCFDAVAEFFGAPSSMLQTELTRHLRNAATPLARRAQLAFFSQGNVAIHMNIAAPKVWIPFSSSTVGAVFLDAGNFQMSCFKKDNQTQLSWNISASDIQVNFAKWRLNEVKERLASPLPFLSSGPYKSIHGVHSIIRPFQVNANCTPRENYTDPEFEIPTQQEGTVKCVNIAVSPICLSLVDAEILARAIGKWYSQGLHSVRGRYISQSGPKSNDSASSSYEKGKNGSFDAKNPMASSLSLTIAKVEMALEGHSKVNFSDERSIESQETSLFGEYAPATRTYIVEVFSIGVKRFQHQDVATTRLTVSDVSIVQLKDSSDYVPMQMRHEASEPQYSILERGRHRDYLETTSEAFKNELGSFDSLTGTEVLRCTIFHDRTIHLDEVEIDIDSIVLRVTTTTLKDCTKGMKKVVELVQLMTKEMERKVHEEGRKARRRDISVDNNTGSRRRPPSPAMSIYSDITDEAKSQMSPRSPSDSSLLFKVTVRDGTLLAGRPTYTKPISKARQLRQMQQKQSFAVVQVLSNALVMFQSIENPDASGTKTIHISLDNLSASVDADFVRVPVSKLSPMIGPTGAEFRVVNATESLGCIVSHDVSLDCEHIKSSLTPNDLSILVGILGTMARRFRGVHDVESGLNGEHDRHTKVKKSSLPFARYQKRGHGIATNIRLEFHDFSFVVLRDFQTKYGAPEFLALKLTDMKLQLGGCVSALSGECTTSISVDFYNAEVSDWEYAVEPFPLSIVIDQMPNELILDVTSSDAVQLNLTGIFLRDLAELDFDILKSATKKNQPKALTPSALSTVGLRRATESHSVLIHNFTGVDIDISIAESNPNVPQTSVRFASMGPGVIKDSCCASLDSVLDNFHFQKNLDIVSESFSKLTLGLSQSASARLGEKERVGGLPIASAKGQSISLHFLNPINRDGISVHNESLRSGRGSPETVQTENTGDPGSRSYHAEPVVEWCMQNQRLRSSTVDMFSMEKGRDLLSSSIWSPEEEYTIENLPTEELEDAKRHQTSPKQKATKSNGKKSNWLRPYLKNDSPEWTDMTCILRMARERVMLPDPSWIWVDDWKVDISGELGDETDAEGWEYEADFETFTRTKRFYKRGDSCRRRRWTRTRIVKPPRLEDPSRTLRFVWETSRDENGNFKIEVRSPLTIQNATDAELSFFVSNPSWDEEILIGSALPGKKVHVPVPLASVAYLRIAKCRTSQKSSSLDDYDVSDKIMMIPTSYNSDVWVRSHMNLSDVSETHLHFLLNIACKKGITNISIQPIVRVLNLLPCQLECQFGEILRPHEQRQVDPKATVPGNNKRKIASVETLNVASGKEGKCIALDPALKPHLSLRVPGYKWSAWQRIVNRKADSDTWRPPESVEDFYLGLNKNDGDHADEFKMLVHFERQSGSGDPLVLILSVESAHCPILRIYAQYWILDKTGFGCRFCESFTDLLGTIPDMECSRRSHLLKEDARDQSMKRDMNMQGHQWSIGMSGMTLYFSLRERLAICIESGIESGKSRAKATKSQWTSPLDVSNVMPKTVFFVDELGGTKRFELAISVTFCPGLFSRTRLINLIPRYQIVNLLKRELVVAQDGCFSNESLIASQSSIPFHWEKGSLPSKVRLGAPSSEQSNASFFDDCWANGNIQLDKVGITSMRLPTSAKVSSKPMVVQAEVRLAGKDQNSAVVIVIWSANEKSNPLYLLRNNTSHTILCRQPLQEEQSESRSHKNKKQTERSESLDETIATEKTSFQCGGDFGPIVRSFFGLDRLEEFVWILHSGETACFGFEDPEKPRILEWTCIENDGSDFEDSCRKAVVEVDAMGSWSTLGISDGKYVRCQIGAEHSTKVIEFLESGRTNNKQISIDRSRRQHDPQTISNDSTIDSTDLLADEEEGAFGIRLKLPSLCISVIDNADPTCHGREILLAQLDNLFASFSQSREGYHEMEIRLMSLQVDNHVPSSIHPVLVFYPKVDATEPFLHFSAVRRLQEHSSTFVFRYAAFRMLDVNVFLDRRTAETVARFIEPLHYGEDTSSDEVPDFVADLTIDMAMKYALPDRRAPRDFEMIVNSANSGRIYFEQLHLHPVRIALTFTQEWTEGGRGTESIMLFQFMRGMASIADAPLTFTSFVVGHVFESPLTLFRVIATHYSSQLTKQIFAILGSLAILGAPADFISNVGTGVRDFFYEPIQGAVHGPRQFIEGLEAGTQSLARGVFVGVVRGAANVTEVVNANLAGLTADDDFIDERKAHQRMLTDAMSRGITSRTLNDSLFLAGASIARGLRSGALGIVEQPTRYASKHGPVGFVKGMGKAMVGAIVKPVVGVGDAAALLMNHVSDATSNREVLPKIPKRLRRALPSRSAQKPNCVILKPYDDRAAKAQKIVTGGESVDDVYIGHVNIPSHLIIASDQCLWAIDRRSREPWCVSWEEISHFGQVKGGMRVVVFSKSGLKPFVFQIDDESECNELDKLLAMQVERMGNAMALVEQTATASSSDLDISIKHIPGIKSKQVRHVFGSCNQNRKRLASTIKDEIDLIEQCFGRVKKMSSASSNFFEALDEEAWTLVSSWGQVFSGLSSRRCIAASVINGTGADIQIKSTKLMEGGSPCYSIPTSEFDAEQGILHAGGAIIFFGWGVVPSLLQAGNVFMHIETNVFIADLADQKSRDTCTEALPGYRINFLEKSYDDAGWWAKYWLLLR